MFFNDPTTTETSFTEESLQYAIELIETCGGDLAVVNTLRAILEQRGCAHEDSILEHDRLVDCIDTIVFG